jgi:hypothetical protein
MLLLDLFQLALPHEVDRLHPESASRVLLHGHLPPANLLYLAANHLARSEDHTVVILGPSLGAFRSQLPQDTTGSAVFDFGLPTTRALFRRLTFM